MSLGGKVDTTAPEGTTGNLLIDPATLEVISGGSTTDITASTVDNTYIGTLLGANNLTLNADTNITISSSISWSSSNTLTLSTNTPGSTIDINAFIASSGNGGLVLNTASASDVITVGSFDGVDLGSFILQSGSWTQTSNNVGTFEVTGDFEVLGSSTFSRFAGGDGSAANPYQIGDIFGLQGLASPSGAFLASGLHFELNR